MSCRFVTMFAFIWLSSSFVGMIEAKSPSPTTTASSFQLDPTSQPSLLAPSPQPTVTSTPPPSITNPPSVAPTPAPTWNPTITPYPSIQPSMAVSEVPSVWPSQYPSLPPSTFEASFDRNHFQQPFIVNATDTNDAFFDVNETNLMGLLFSSYTSRFAPVDSAHVDSLCEIILVNGQRIIESVNNTTDSSITFTNIVDYTCQYQSRHVNVSGYPLLFMDYINNNLTGQTLDLQDIQLPVLSSSETGIVSVITTSPTVSVMPSSVPSSQPSTSPRPTTRPTASPTDIYQPSFSPTPPLFPTNPGPTSDSSNPSGTKISVPAIASIVVLSAVAILIGLVFYLQRRRQKRVLKQLERNRRDDQEGILLSNAEEDDPFAATTSADPSVFRINPNDRDSRNSTTMMMMTSNRQSEVDTEAGVMSTKGPAVSPNGSWMSNKSLISEGEAALLDRQSSEEMDGTKNLQDEFDQYKDQNLEQLRSDVEGNLTGFEGIMSAAVTKALMGCDDDSKMDPGELFWGCPSEPPPSGAEVEASALCEVCDWLKRNENASVERKRSFMQDMLNKMVASVRHGVLNAEDAARTIHESAALLELQLAHELPTTTVIVSGMRMSVEASAIVNGLEEFGEIDTAAVASGERGFGIVRFRHSKSVDRAMRRYRTDEIVIEDVAIQMKVLTPSGEVLSRA